MTFLGRVATLVRSRPILVTLSVAGVFAAAGFGAAVTISETTYSAIFGDVADIGTGFTITSAQIGVIKATTAADGTTSGSANEMVTSAAGDGNTALTKAHWFYKVVVEESAVASVTSGTYKLELFSDDTSQGSLYVKQDTSDASNVEGVTLKWDVGADLPSGATAYRIVVTAV
ncbi:MAG TPA: hypothetical protein VI997_12650 [Candidatus Thermoplasmatota archaeon]|nr:hypothetical protein [Candidatus Thermoplasmatota archaeon]